MVEQVPQGFSWSATRSRLFEDCPLAYYYHYYLALGRSRQAERSRSFEAKRLRSMSSVPMWIGSSVHDAIERILKKVRERGEVDPGREKQEMLKGMRRDYLNSLNDLARKRNDARNLMRFHEHEYGPAPGKQDWKQAADDAVAMLEAWWRLPYLEQVVALAPDQILGIEDLDSWSFHGVPIWVKIDLAYRDGDGRVHILDWKTGRKISPDNPLQMTGYSVYAEKSWGVDLANLAVREVYLRLDDPEKWCQIDVEAIDNAKVQILESIRGMLGALENPAVNVAEEAGFPAAPADGKCRRCNFRGICPDKLIMQ